MSVSHKVLQHHQNYENNRCFPDFPNGGYGSRFNDAHRPDNFSTLSSGFFWWLINIHPSHLLYRQDNMCYIEPYIPSLFARQFGYTQLYVGNLNRALVYQGNLFEGALEWFHFAVGGVSVKFVLPQKSFIMNTVLSSAPGMAWPTRKCLISRSTTIVAKK